MNVVRLIVVKVNPAQAKEAENIWKQHCAPLMIKEPGCVSEKLLRCTDEPRIHLLLGMARPTKHRKISHR